jgi:hypothetical protein
VQASVCFDQNEKFVTLVRDLELVRIPLEKHEIARDNKLKEPQPVRGWRGMSHFVANSVFCGSGGCAVASAMIGVILAARHASSAAQRGGK